MHMQVISISTLTAINSGGTPLQYIHECGIQIIITVEFFFNILYKYTVCGHGHYVSTCSISILNCKRLIIVQNWPKYYDSVPPFQQ